MDKQKATLIIAPKMEQKGLTMEADRTEFAVALRTWRIRSKLTQRQVAARWGVSRNTIMRVEGGKSIKWETAYLCYNYLVREINSESINFNQGR